MVGWSDGAGQTFSAGASYNFDYSRARASSFSLSLGDGVGGGGGLTALEDNISVYIGSSLRDREVWFVG